LDVKEDTGVTAEVWPVGQMGGTVYRYLHHDTDQGLSTTITIANDLRDASTLKVSDVSTQPVIPHNVNAMGVLMFQIEPGHDYNGAVSD
jgi:hypothetical protein